MTFADYLQTQPMLRVAVALMCGIVLGDKVVGFFPLWLSLASIAFLLVVYFLLKEKPYIQSLVIFIAIFLAGVTLAAKADYDVLDPFPSDAPLEYEAVIADEPQVRGKVLRCDIVITGVGGSSLRSPVKVKAAILRDTVKNNWRRLRLGSGIKALSVMQPLENFSEGGNFDYVRWLRCHGFKAQTFIFYLDWHPSRVSLSPLSFTEIMRMRTLKFREKLVSRLVCGDTASGENQQTAVAAAMVLGDKHGLSSRTKDEYSISGASHVLALSGLHLGIIYAILSLFFGKGNHRCWLSQAIIIIAIWTYVVIVGMGTSVVRSAVMLTVYSLCMVAGREKASVNALSLSAVVMLVANPLCLWDIGFQMSYMAVLSIVVFYKRICRLLPGGGSLTRYSIANRLIKAVWCTAVVSFAAQIGTAPLVAYYFGRFSCYFLLTNYIVVPCATVIIYGTVAVFLTIPVPFLNVIVLRLVTWVLAFLNSSVGWISSLPGASVDNIHVSTVQLFCYYAAVAIVSIVCSYLSRLRSLKKLDSFE